MLSDDDDSAATNTESQTVVAADSSSLIVSIVIYAVARDVTRTSVTRCCSYASALIWRIQVVL